MQPNIKLQTYLKYYIFFAMFLEVDHTFLSVNFVSDVQMTACEVTQRVKALSAESDNPNSIPETHMVQGESWLPQTVL